LPIEFLRRLVGSPHLQKPGSSRNSRSFQKSTAQLLPPEFRSDRQIEKLELILGYGAPANESRFRLGHQPQMILWKPGSGFRCPLEKRPDPREVVRLPGSYSKR
jgi:hypothetical protein